MSPEREKGDFATGSSLLDNTKSELPLQGKRERRPILQKGCDFMFKHKTKIGAVILAMVTATALLSGCGADTAKEYDKHLKPETTVSVDKDADKVDDKKDSKESDKKADKADKQEDSKESSKPAEKPADKNNGKKNDKPAESKPSKPANSGAVNKPSTSKPSNPAPAPSKPAPSKPNKPAPSEPSGNTGNNSANKPSTSKPAHQHDWQPVYTTVHHEAQYRNEPVYEDQIVYEDRPVYKWQAYWTCNGCGQRFNSENDVLDHVLFECGTGYTPHEEKVQTGTEQVQVGTNKVQIGTNPVLVKEAWDEQVKTGSVCTKCNAHK